MAVGYFAKSAEAYEYEQNNPIAARELRNQAKLMADGDRVKENNLYNALLSDAVEANKAYEKRLTAEQASPIETLSKDVTNQIASGAADAKKAASGEVPAEAASFVPTVADSAKVYDMSSYTRRATSLVESESAANNKVRAQLEAMRANISKRSQERAKNENRQYIQEMKAALGDNTTINSTVPVAQEQTPDTVENDDKVEETAPMTVEEAYIALKTMTLNPGEAEAAYAALMEGDPSVVEQIIHDHEAYAQAEAQYLAELDATKQVSMELAKEAGKEFAKGTLEDIAAGNLSAGQLLNNFDFFMTNLGNSIGTYVGAALSGIPSPNDCSSQTLTNFGLGVSGTLGIIEKASTVANGLATFGINLADSMTNIYQHGPELLLAMAETTAQTAAQTTLMALRNAARTNCTIAFGMDVASGTVAVAGSAIKAGISIAGKAQDLKGSAEKLIRVVKKKDFVGDLKRKVKLHPAVREMNNFLEADKLDIATYSRLTRNGDKFARVMLGVDAQNRFSSVKKHMVSVSKAKPSINSHTWSTSSECNRWNMYAKQNYSLANLF